MAMLNQISHKSLKVLFTGSSGTGKTNAFIKFLYGSEYDHYFIFDHEGEILGRLEAKGIEASPFHTFEEIDEYFDGEETRNATEYSNLIIFDPSINFAGEYEEAFEDFCRYVFNLCPQIRGKKLFACDELQILTGNQVITKPLQAILQTGRRRGIDCAFCSQAPNELHNKIRNQFTFLVNFRTIDARALSWIKDLQFPEIDRLLTLPDGEAICRNLRNGEETQLLLDLSN